MTPGSEPRAPLALNPRLSDIAEETDGRSNIRRLPVEEPWTLDDVFQEFVEPIYRFVYRHVGNREDAEDLTSEVFLKASRGLDTGRSREEITRWLFTVARSALNDHWRRHYRIPALLNIDDFELADAGSRPANPTAASQTDLRVDSLLAGLPDRQAQLLRLRFLRGYTIAETAEELGITVANAKVIQHRALAAAVKLTEERS